MVGISANTIKEIFISAEKQGIFYPGLYEMVMLIFNCGVPRQELVGLKIGDVFSDGMKNRAVRCPAVVRYLQGLRKDGKLQKDMPLFPRYFPGKEKKFYGDFKKVCMCVVGKPIKCAEIKTAGMKSFFLELDSIKGKEIDKGIKELKQLIEQYGPNEFIDSRGKQLKQELKAYKSSPSHKYKDVAKQYGYNNAGQVSKIIRGWKKQYSTNQDRLEEAFNNLEVFRDHFDVKQLEQQIWKILYYAYHRDQKKGDRPQIWHAKKYLVDSYKRVESLYDPGKTSIPFDKIKEIFEKIAIAFPEKLPNMTKDEMED